MGSIHMRRIRDQVRMVTINILPGGQIVQSPVGTDIVIDPFPILQLLVELIKVAFRRVKSIEFIQMGSMSAFHSAIEFGRTRR